MLSEMNRQWLPVLRRMEDLARTRERMLITLDGPCASGKTTAAAFFGERLGVPVLHTDDFVVPHARKTPERLSIPGGNCDWERLTRELLGPWKEGGRAVVRKYDFRSDRFCPPEALPDTPLLILEGSYCNLPAIRALADLRLFAATDPAERRARLEKRESPDSLRRFDLRWIPLENAYFRAYRLPDPGCVLLPCGDSSPKTTCP